MGFLESVSNLHIGEILSYNVIKHIFFIISCLSFWHSNYRYVRTFDIVSQVPEVLFIIFNIFYLDLSFLQRKWLPFSVEEVVRDIEGTETQMKIVCTVHKNETTPFGYTWALNL